jgi:Flp pilus assembly protein CpaB
VATEVKQRNNRVLVLVGAVVAIGAFAAVLYLSRSNNSSSGTSGSSGAATVSVVVAKTDLLQGTQLTADQLAVTQYNADQAPVGSYPDAGPVVGQFLAVGVTKNTPIVPGDIAPNANTAKAQALTTAPLNIRSGYVAMAIPASFGSDDAHLTNVACYIHPEDHIDMLIDPGNASIRYAFQDVRVLTTGDFGAAAASACPSNYTVELPRDQAESMAFLMTNKGPATVVRYVLRSSHDDSNPASTPQNKNGEAPKYLDSGSTSVPAFKDNPVTTQLFNALFPAK